MVAKDFKNVAIIVRSNSNIEKIFKKYKSAYNNDLVQNKKIYYFPEIINMNQEFPIKCGVLIKELKLFLEFISNK